MKLLLTAFEPFGGAAENASREALALLPEEIAGAEIVKRTLPVVFGAAEEELRRAVAEERPDAVLCLGEAGSRKALTPETTAVNLVDARIPDNAGAQPRGRPLAEGGPAACRATLPVVAMAAAIRAAGLPAELSDSAGTFVCNAVFYALLRLLDERYPGARGGFLHLPRPEESGLTYEDLARGVEAAAGAIAGGA